MCKTSGEQDSKLRNDNAVSVGTKMELLRRRAAALRSIAEAESTDNAEAAAEARKHVQDAQRQILRYGLE